MIALSTERLLKIQIIVAVIAVAITAFSLFQLSPLIEKQAALKADIRVLEAKRTELQRDNHLLAKAAKPASESVAKNVEAWIYVGRTSGGKWAPAADGVAPTPTPTIIEGFHAISTSKNVTLVGEIGNISSSQNDAADTPQLVQLVKAGSVLEVLELKTQRSIGDAFLVWARVNVPAAKLLEISAK
jgi:hypothetical protein